jgi:hypothetical protein
MIRPSQSWSLHEQQSEECKQCISSQRLWTLVQLFGKKSMKLFVWVFQRTYLNLSGIVVNSRVGEIILEELCSSLVFLEKLFFIILKQHSGVWKSQHSPEYRGRQRDWWLPLDLNNSSFCVELICAPKYQFFEVFHLRNTPDQCYA